MTIKELVESLNNEQIAALLDLLGVTSSSAFFDVAEDFYLELGKVGVERGIWDIRGIR